MTAQEKDVQVFIDQQRKAIMVEVKATIDELKAQANLYDLRTDF